jgi:hypothetical protein
MRTCFLSKRNVLGRWRENLCRALQTPVLSAWQILSCSSLSVHERTLRIRLVAASLCVELLLVKEYTVEVLFLYRCTAQTSAGWWSVYTPKDNFVRAGYSRCLNGALKKLFLARSNGYIAPAQTEINDDPIYASPGTCNNDQFPEEVVWWYPD